MNIQLEDDGGPVFPGKYQGRTVTGISLRDYFAAKALQGFCSDSLEDDPESAAERAYEYADAMLNVRAAFSDELIQGD